MTKTQIFEEVVSIMKTDASCCKDEPGADPEQYRCQITDDMEDEAFLYLMQSYIASFHVKAHLHFMKKNRAFLPFHVKRYQDALYVFDTAPNSPLQVGDRIDHIDGQSVRDYAALHLDMLHGEPEERQGFSWAKLLTFAHEISVVGPDGTRQTRPIQLTTTWETADPYVCKKLRENVAYLRLADFADDIAIAKTYAENDTLLRESEYLIIDVRANGGGNDSAFMPLLEFCLPEGIAADTLKAGIYDGGIEMNYSVRNCDARIAMLEAHMQQEIPADTRNMLSSMLNQLKQNYGKGFVAYTEEDTESLPHIGAALPKKVFLITDEDCGSSGDSFVDMMRKSPKVTVVGRPTMGILDFSNCTLADFGEYALFYPTSRNLYLDRGIRMRGHGIPVDLEIPWTPEHLVRDVDLDTVLEEIDRMA